MRRRGLHPLDARRPRRERALHDDGTSRTGSRLVWWLGALVAVVVLLPLLRRGTVLAYDMVFPLGRQPLRPESFGLGTGPPRAVPQDAVVAALSRVVPGWLLQRLVLIAVLVGAAVGAGRLVPTRSLAGRATAALVYAWNPYVAERLLLGQWSLLVGYAALPWVLSAGLQVRAGDRGAGSRLVLAAGVASLTPSGGVLALVTGLVGAGRRGAALALPLGLLQAPWVVPSLLHVGVTTSDAAGVEAFAVRAEGWAGVPGAVLGLGGIWNAQVVPASRTTVVAPLLSLAVLVLALWGGRALVRSWGRPASLALAGLVAASLIVTVAGAAPVLSEVLKAAVATVPGAGLLRDGHKWLAPAALLLSVGAGAGCARLAASPRRRGLAVACLLLPVAAVPDLAWGGAGRLQPVRPPGDWAVVAGLLEAAEQPGSVVSLPFTPYRAYAWNGGRPSLDPAPRWLDADLVVDDRLLVGSTVLAGEDPRAREIGHALDQGRPLGELGVGWVLVQHATPGEVPPSVTRAARLVHRGDALSLWRLPDVQDVEVDRPPAVPVLLAHAAALLVLLMATVSALRGARRRSVA